MWHRAAGAACAHRCQFLGPSGWPGVDLELMSLAGLSPGPMLNVHLLPWDGSLGSFEGKYLLALTSFI